MQPSDICCGCCAEPLMQLVCTVLQCEVAMLTLLESSQVDLLYLSMRHRMCHMHVWRLLRAEHGHVKHAWLSM